MEGDREMTDPSTIAGSLSEAHLLEEIRQLIWSHTGCSDKRAKEAATAVVDLLAERDTR